MMDFLDALLDNCIKITLALIFGMIGIIGVTLVILAFIMIGMDGKVWLEFCTMSGGILLIALMLTLTDRVLGRI